MMSENTQTGAMNYDNLALKCWLYCIGPVRRCEELKKLKADLQNLGLSRRQVHQGLIQLATKPHVVLTRQIPYRRYRFKNLSEDERGKNIIDNLRTKALNLRPRIEDIHKSNTTERFIKKENKYIKKADGVTAYENALISSNQELFVPNICYKLKNPLATMHSFDETLKQLDECISSKMIVNEKSTNIKKLENNIVSSKKCNKDENHHCICEHKNTQKIQEVPNLISDKVSSKRILMFNKYKKKRIEPKLKLNSCFAKKVRNDSIKSDDYKKVDTKNVKSDIGKKLHNDKKIIDINDNSMPDKNTYSKHEDSTLNCSHNTEEVTKVMENTHKRKLRKLIVSDKNKEIIKKKRKIKDRFRTYFGDCISVSEDEQEQNIIEERFRKTRKRDSVDSCESGVYVAERNITMTAAHVDIIQKSNEDTSQGIIANVDINHKPNDDISQRTIANLDIIHKLNKNTSQETIVNVDTNYGLNEDTSQRTIVNVDVIHKSNEDTSQAIIANVDKSHKSNEGTSQGTIANIIQKSDEDTSRRIIANVDVIHESNEDTSQGIIANVDTSHKSNEDTSQSTIANIIQESDKDTSQGNIVNVDTIHESNEVADNTNNKTTNQIGGATNFVEIECNKLQNNTHENKTHNTEIEKKELSRNKEFINFSEKNNIEKSKHASSVTDIFQITEKSKVNVSTAKIKATTEINNILPSDIPEICIPSHDTVAISKNLSGSEKSNLDTTDLNDLLHMRSFKTCQIRSNGNVLSIQEIDMNADVGENSHLKKLSEIQINCNHSITERVLNYNEKDKEVQLSSNTNKTDNVISTNNISNVKNNENELAVKNSELSILEKKDIQSNKLPQGKLRVLSSAELGARWCPTPVNSVTSTVQFSHENTETQTVPETTVSIPAPVSETASQTTIPKNMKKYTDSKFSKFVYVTLIKIRNLIQNIRISPNTNLNYDKLLNMEFQKLRKILNTDDFIDLIKGIVNILNKEMLVIPPLSLNELFLYAPSVKSYYVQILNKNKTIINSLSECRTVKSVGVPNQITLNQNRSGDAQASQDIRASSTQSRLQYLLSISSEQGQTLRPNIVPNQPQQNFQDQIVLPLQNNVLQSNVLVNPITMNNNSHNNNMHQHTYMQVHANFTQQKVSNVNFAKQNPVTNMHVRQSYPLQYSLFLPTGRNQLGGVHTSIPVTNASSINQQYVSSVFIPQTNTYCNINVPSYTIQQNMNSTHISQGTQLQGVSQSVSPNHNIPQPVKTMVATNISHSAQQNMNSTHMSQGIQLQGVSQSVSPHHNIPQPVQQNMNSKHMLQGTQLQGVSQSVSPNRNIPQLVQTMVATNISHSVQQNMNSTHMSQGTRLQGISQSVSPHRNIPQPAQQNMNSTHMSQRTQLQGVSQSVSPNHNIPQPVQTMVATNISHSVQQNMNSTHMSQGTQLQGVSRSVSPHRNIPQPVQQNMSSKHMSQGTRLQGISQSVSPHRNIPQPAQQNMNSTHMSQGTQLQGVSQSVSPNHNIPQPVQTMVGTNISHSVQQNMNSTHMSQGTQLQGVSRSVSPHCNIPQPVQQNMNSTHMSQGTQLQGVSRSVSPHCNIPQPVQQNMNSTHMSQGTQLQGVSQSVSPNHNIPQLVQTMVAMNISHSVQQNMNSTHMSQGSQLQGVLRSVSPHRNIQQYIQTMVATNISHSVPKNSQHIEQKHQKVVPQKRIPMEVPQNRISEQVASSQQLKKSTLRRLKKKENLQVSLESTTNLFDILKYISDIQKLILLKQLDYYFGCTTWLQQQFTSEKWQEIHSERSVLLHFQTLLKHLVEKTIKSLLPDNYQTNILKNIEIDVPKVIQITIKENNGICCEVEAAKSNQEQYNAMNIKQNCTNYKENSNVTITQNQCDKEHEATDNSQTNGSSIKQNLQSHQTSNVDVCQENKVEREPNSSRNIYNSNTKELNLDESTKITENIPQIGIEKSSALSNMKLLNKDTLQQLNPHLVIVEISSKNDQVTVVDTNANSENTPKSKESEEYQEHQYLKGTITDDLTVSSFKSPNNIEYFNNKESHNTSLERPPTTYIKDVRSISMEAYLRIGVTNNVPANTMEENIEEEEIKICLYCGKPSTVACIICLEAKYCSKECSQLHWGDHYKDCSPVERSISS
ncbi:protein PF14_0175-like isoform X2 [Bombus pyrosoma]|uniref:protein PF14_0175-like isoform X2 n=1 Tax=Bombus pyrosoma TaxID=396416 RepID=UPI001CB9B195|nr:protein PF14_0175-like isoform X2 [Bombus pyrosoma]XP_043579041.1 protein PF14_0175-like isoform X2 [Bombus pyrosoma]XP_043579042.1 protein PF14_0175-like isoform X2 [Bombus pyrosoma]XP_043579043.1 protein PF14_0175-like isoform X2 [Bombus pyrosoma]XP_043579044.1 protein PF14_0175-like isoform X2 [Bombus pyrosoma]XP_043579045.1 protein PF14_0175-like isoform X2 [Bombus pyrosoma]XP_043579046.1 protein PF14_0175-like isoform X2 [Bombus pyrosoma]